MFNLFKTRLTAQELHTAIMLYNSELLADIEVSRNRDAEQGKVKALQETGFTSTKEYGLLTGSYDLCITEEDIKMAKAYFPKALFIRKADFMELLLKYKLVCGMAKDYIGDIPDKNLREVQEALTIINGKDDIYDWRINQNFIYVDEVIITDGLRTENSWSKDDALKISAFPFAYDCGNAMPTSLIPYTHEHGRTLKPTDFLIAAPAKFINHKVEISRHQPIFRPKSRIDDPIVFQILPCGIIMIHTMWGEEANDPIFKDKNKVL